MIGKLLKNNWVVTIIGGALSVLVLRLFDSFFINDFLWDGIKSGFNAVVNFFNTEHPVKLYFLVLLPILGMMLLGALVFLFRQRKTDSIINIPEWVNYTIDVFDGIQYRWQYDTRSGKYDIASIRPHCNDCSCAIVDQVCPNCKKNFDWRIDDTPGIKTNRDVRALVVHRIENGLYKTSPYFKA